MPEFHRSITEPLINALQQVPVVVLLGPRQVGKTTLALSLSNEALGKNSSYLDVELPSDRNKLADAEAYLMRFDNQLLIIDEVQHLPNLFTVLRAIVDRRKRAGEKAGHFLLLGSASRELLQLSAETLAGRIRYLELSPLGVAELHQADPLGFGMEKHWFRGGFPDSYLGNSDDESWRWRQDFIATYVERDIPVMGPQVAPERLKRFWSMVAHYHGRQVVYAELGKSLGVSHTTAKKYLDILTDFYMIRQIQPWSGNSKKRLIRSPRIFIRDSGLLHALLFISNFDALLGNPVVGFSWEGYVIEQIMQVISTTWRVSYYRSEGQAEIDLVLEKPNEAVWAIEIKKTLSPNLQRGFYEACKDIEATHKFVIYSGTEKYPLPNQVEAIGLLDFLSIPALKQ